MREMTLEDAVIRNIDLARKNIDLTRRIVDFKKESDKTIADLRGQLYRAQQTAEKYRREADTIRGQAIIDHEAVQWDTKGDYVQAVRQKLFDAEKQLNATREDVKRLTEDRDKLCHRYEHVIETSNRTISANTRVMDLLRCKISESLKPRKTLPKRGKKTTPRRHRGFSPLPMYD